VTRGFAIAFLLVGVPATTRAAVTDISAQSSTTCAVADGAAWCWGDNASYGLLGNGFAWGASATPVKVQGLEKDVSAISVGGHVCAIASGAVWCWGDNRWGELGIGSKTTALTPRRVDGLPAPVTAISAGQYHTCAIAAGEAWCWGHGIYGQLGNGQRRDVSRPVKVRELGDGVTAIATSAQASCAVARAVVKCWGLNSQAELGPFKRADSAVPVEIAGVSDATAVSCGYAKCCAIAAGAVKCWGDMASVVEPDAPAVKDPIAIAAVVGAGSVAVDGHVCATVARKLLCWGDNQHGQVAPKTDGDGSVRAPTEVRGLRGVTQVAVGRTHTCAIADGKAYCWGNFSAGQLGNGKRAADSMFDPSLNQPAPQLVKW
jgi:serine/threonine-protein kinase